MSKDKKLMRVVTISHAFKELIRGQMAYLDQHFEVVGVASDVGSLDEVGEAEGVRVVNVDMAREISLWRDVKSLVALYRLFRREKPYIVHANTPKASLLSMVAAWAARVPHRLYTVTGLRFETTRGILRCVLKTMERITCLCATKIIPEGDGVRDTLRREHITRKPLQKILNGNINGIDLTHFDRTPEVEQRARELRRADMFSFVFVGRMVKDKGMNELVAAFERLSRVREDVRLVLVGRFENIDPLLPETVQLIERNERIVMAGYQSDVRPYLAASDVLVLPSYREGFPNVVIQAGAMGLPSIVTDISGSNEIILDNKNGVIIPKQDADALYEAMLRLCTETQTTTRLGSEARSMVAARYSQAELWKAILEMYESLPEKAV